jgi:hypothetical protein
MEGTRISAVHRALGDAFFVLPPEVQSAHDNGGSLRLSGRASVTVASGLLSRFICWAVGLPRDGVDQPVNVVLCTRADGFDHWQRDFDGRRYQSVLHAGTGPNQGKLIEKLGIFTTVFALEAQSGHLKFEVTQMKLFGVPLPQALSLRCRAFESGHGGFFTFDITMDMPFTGRLIHYRGRLSQ